MSSEKMVRVVDGRYRKKGTLWQVYGSTDERWFFLDGAQSAILDALYTAQQEIAKLRECVETVAQWDDHARTCLHELASRNSENML